MRTHGSKTTLYLPGGMELTAAGSTVTAQRYYTFNGQTVAMRTAPGASGQTTIVADHHSGSPGATSTPASVGTGVVQVAQATNTFTRRYTDPYGQARGTAAAWTGDRGFLDKTTDATGLTQVGAPYYDPPIGRLGPLGQRQLTSSTR